LIRYQARRIISVAYNACANVV